MKDKVTLPCKCGGVFSVSSEEDKIDCNKCGLETSILVEFIGLCGCGSQYDLIELVVSALVACSMGPVECSNWIGATVEREFIIQTLNDRGLLEHGVSASCSWISDLGRKVLVALKSLEIHN